VWDLRSRAAPTNGCSSAWWRWRSTLPREAGQRRRPFDRPAGRDVREPRRGDLSAVFTRVRARVLRRDTERVFAGLAALLRCVAFRFRPAAAARPAGRRGLPLPLRAAATTVAATTTVPARAVDPAPSLPRSCSR